MNKRLEKQFFMFSIAAGILGIYILYLVTSGQQLWIDTFFEGLLETSNETILSLFGYITELGSAKGIGSIALLTVLWLGLKYRDFTGMATIALAVGLGNEVNKLLKNWVGRERPALEHLDEVASLSFPSGHAMVGIIIYMLIAYFLVKYIPSKVGKRLAVTVCSIIILLVGISRVVLHVHYPSDVIGGFAFGFIWAFLWMLIYQALQDWLAKRK
jgi:membrane-associated phospholipid phosphatase